VLQKFNEKLARYTIALRHFIHNPIVLQYFIKHCEAEYSSENINVLPSLNRPYPAQYRILLTVALDVLVLDGSS
jgi:hypothetical protein